jgi:hypothetical protein
MEVRLNTNFQQQMPGEPPAAIAREEVQVALGRILDSKQFVHAPKKQKFLRLLSEFYVQGRVGELNEYLIGREVFDRDEQYNPADDPIVRVGAHDVRKKLELYYQHDGAEDDIRLEIPVGSYEPVFRRRRSIESEAPSAPPREELPQVVAAPAPVLHLNPSVVANDVALPAEPVAGRWRSAIVLGAFSGLLLVAMGYLGWSNWALRQQVAERNGVREFAGAVWQPILETEKPALLVLSNPTVYRLGNAGDLPAAVKNSVSLTPEQARALAAAHQDNFAIRNLTPDPRLVASVGTYTGIGEAIGAQRVTDLLRTAGKSVLLKRSRTMSAEDLKDHPAILFGSVWSNEWSGKLPQMEDFVYTGRATIENRGPREGEAREYQSKFDVQTGRLIEDYALVTLKPGLGDESPLMVLSGLRSAGTEAAAEFVTNRNHLGELNRRLIEAGSPRHYQVLLRVGVENGIPTTISIVTIHPLHGK